MCKRKSLIAAPVVALLLLAGARAEAGPISFGFNFTPGTADLSHPLVVQPSGALAALADGDTGGMVTFTNEPANTATATFNTNTSSYTTTITATNLRTVSTASPNSPDTLNASGAYSLSLVLTSPDPARPRASWSSQASWAVRSPVPTAPTSPMPSPAQPNRAFSSARISSTSGSRASPAPALRRRAALHRSTRAASAPSSK